MAERNPPVWLQSGTYAAQDDRIVTGLLVDRRSDRFGTFAGLDGGVVPPLDQMRVTAAGGNSMDFFVSAGVAIIPSPDNDPPGAYVVSNEGRYSSAANNTTIKAEGSGNSRIDLVIARIYDSVYTGAESSWKIEVVRGNPAPNPKTPRIPVGAIAIRLAAITVLPKGKNGGVNKITGPQIRDLRQFISAPGGVHLWWRTAKQPAPASSPGRLVYDVSNRSLSLWGWDPKRDRMILDPIYTYNEWRAYFARFRPRQTALGTYVYTTGTKWTGEPRQTSNDRRVGSGISIEKVKAPNRIIKVSLMSFGRVTRNDASGHLSVAVRRSGGKVVWEPQISRSISFYNRTWEHHGATWMIPGLPPDDNLTVSLRFTLRDAGAKTVVSGEKQLGRAIFGKTVLVVEPVL